MEKIYKIQHLFTCDRLVVLCHMFSHFIYLYCFSYFKGVVLQRERDFTPSSVPKYHISWGAAIPKLEGQNSVCICPTGRKDPHACTIMWHHPGCASGRVVCEGYYRALDPGTLMWDSNFPRNSLTTAPNHCSPTCSHKDQRGLELFRYVEIIKHSKNQIWDTSSHECPHQCAY